MLPLIPGMPQTGQAFRGGKKGSFAEDQPWGVEGNKERARQDELLRELRKGTQPEPELPEDENTPFYLRKDYIPDDPLFYTRPADNKPEALSDKEWEDVKSGERAFSEWMEARKGNETPDQTARRQRKEWNEKLDIKETFLDKLVEAGVEASEALGLPRMGQELGRAVAFTPSNPEDTTRVNTGIERGFRFIFNIPADSKERVFLGKKYQQANAQMQQSLGEAALKKLRREVLPNLNRDDGSVAAVIKKAKEDPQGLYAIALGTEAPQDVITELGEMAKAVATEPDARKLLLQTLVEDLPTMAASAVSVAGATKVLTSINSLRKAYAVARKAGGTLSPKAVDQLLIDAKKIQDLTKANKTILEKVTQKPGGKLRDIAENAGKDFVKGEVMFAPANVVANAQRGRGISDLEDLARVEAESAIPSAIMSGGLAGVGTLFRNPNVGGPLTKGQAREFLEKIPESHRGAAARHGDTRGANAPPALAEVAEMAMDEVPGKPERVLFDRAIEPGVLPEELGAGERVLRVPDDAKTFDTRTDLAVQRVGHFLQELDRRVEAGDHISEKLLRDLEDAGQGLGDRATSKVEVPSSEPYAPHQSNAPEIEAAQADVLPAAQRLRELADEMPYREGGGESTPGDLPPSLYQEVNRVTGDMADVLSQVTTEARSPKPSKYATKKMLAKWKELQGEYDVAVASAEVEPEIVRGRGRKLMETGMASRLAEDMYQTLVPGHKEAGEFLPEDLVHTVRRHAGQVDDIPSEPTVVQSSGVADRGKLAGRTALPIDAKKPEAPKLSPLKRAESGYLDGEALLLMPERELNHSGMRGWRMTEGAKGFASVYTKQEANLGRSRGVGGRVAQYYKDHFIPIKEANGLNEAEWATAEDLTKARAWQKWQELKEMPSFDPENPSNFSVEAVGSHTDPIMSDATIAQIFQDVAESGKAPAIEKAADQMVGYFRELARRNRESGLWSAELYEMITKNDQYVPLIWESAEVSTSNKMYPGGVRGGGKGLLREMFNLREGGVDEGLRRVSTSAMDHTNASFKHASFAKTFQTFLHDLKLLPNSNKDAVIMRSMVQELSESQAQQRVPPAGKEILRFWDGATGTEKAYLVDDMVTAALRLDPNKVTNNGLLRVVVAGTSFMRMMYTQFAPEFIARNFFVDIQETLLTGKHTGDPSQLRGSDISTAVKDVIKKVSSKDRSAPIADEMRRAGAEIFSYETGQLLTDQAALVERVQLGRSLSEKRQSLGKKAWAPGRVAGIPFHFVKESISRAADFTESVTRTANFIAGGRTSADRALSQARRATMDFARMGNAIRTPNQVVAFLAAGIQGTEIIARKMKSSPEEFMRAFVAFQAVPALALSLYNTKNPHYATVNQYDKENNWIVMLPDGKYIKIPMPHSARATTPLLREIGDRIGWELQGQKPFAPKQSAVKTTLEHLLPVGSDIIDYVPTMFAPAMALYYNRKPGTETPISPVMDKWSGIVGGLSGVGATKRTNPLLTEVGLRSHINPAALEYVLRTVGGGFASVGLKTISLLYPDESRAIQQTGLELEGPEYPLYNIPLLGSFLGESDIQNLHNEINAMGKGGIRWGGGSSRGLNLKQMGKRISLILDDELREEYLKVFNEDVASHYEKVSDIDSTTRGSARRILLEEQERVNNYLRKNLTEDTDPDEAELIRQHALEATALLLDSYKATEEQLQSLNP